MPAIRGKCPKRLSFHQIGKTEADYQCRQRTRRAGRDKVGPSPEEGGFGSRRTGARSAPAIGGMASGHMRRFF